MILFFKNLISNPLIFLIIFILFLLVFLVRTVGLLENNSLFIFDSARDFLRINKIIVDHKPVLIGTPAGGLQGYFHGVIWYYILALPLALSGGHPISGQWFMAILSTLSVIAVFFLLKKMMNIYAGILGVLFFGFGNFSIATAKFTWNSYPIVWLTPLFFYGMYLLVKNRAIGILIISLAQGLALQFDLMIGLTTFLGYLVLLGYYLINGKFGKIKYTVIAILLISLPFLPSIFFDIRHDFIISKAVVNTIVSRGSNLSHKEDESPTPLSKRISLRFGELIKYSLNSMTPNTFVNYGLFVILFFSISSIVKSKHKEYKVLFALSMSIFVSMFLVLLMLKYSVWGHYWMSNAPFYTMVLSFGIGYLVGENRSKVLYFVSISFILLFVYQSWNALSYWRKGDLDPGPQTLSTQLKVVDTVYTDAGGKPFSFYHQTPPVYDYVYRYLFWWRGSKKYHYIPSNEKQELVYVILDGVPQDLDGSYFKKHTLHLKTNPLKTFSFNSSYPRVEKFVIDPKSEEPVDPNFFPQL